jgi:hypothetical protein
LAHFAIGRHWSRHRACRRLWLSLEIGRVADEKIVKNRIHLDLRADGTSQDEEVRRLLDLGAERIDVGQPADATWIVLADPEGNEFCLLFRSVQEVVGSA